MEADRPSQSSGGRSWQQRGSSRRRRRRRKNWVERLGDWTRSFLAFLFSNVGIVCLVVGYTIAGAFLFARIETGGDPKLRRIGRQVQEFRNLTAEALWKLTSENVLPTKVWKSRVTAILEKYQEKMVMAINEGYDGVDSGKQWTFAGAFLYSLTVITTIGYGNICPKTIYGKLVTIVYAIIGMPLFLLYLSNIGDIFARCFKWIYARCCLCKCRKRSSDSTDGSEVAQPPQDIELRRSNWQMVRAATGEFEASGLAECATENESSDYDPQQVTVPLTLCLATMVGYICGGAILFSEWEDWNFLDGSYFCFISLSTIGFGDIVPGDKIYSGQGLELSFIFCSMYLMLGMALIAMCFNLMQEEVVAKFRTMGRIIKYIFRCDR